MPQTPDLAYACRLPPQDAIAYLESKGYALGFSWTDIWQEAHAKAFTAAGVMKVEVLADLKAGLVDALKKGTTRQDYIRNLTPMLQRKGWWGSDAQVDESTGELHGKGLTPRRLATIFDTNMQTAYMAGRYKAFMANVGDRPFWQYVAVMDGRTRAAHAALNGRTFRYDDPIWQTSFPPNGFRCRCGVRALDHEDLRSRGIDLSSSEGRLSDVEVPTSRQPDGPTATVKRFEYAPGRFFAPDAGWSYNPGEAGLAHLRQILIEQANRAEPALARVSVQSQVSSAEFVRWFERPAGDFPVAVLDPENAARIGALMQVAVLSEASHAKQADRHPEVSVRDYQRVQEVIDHGRAYQDTAVSLVFVRDTPEGVTVVVKATHSGDGLFLTSLRYLPTQSAQRAAEIRRVERKAAAYAAKAGDAAAQ
ncbi:MAG TPA: phage minor head protein [Plasticicumulans sp.]|uniref:phage head morphogenesis protein n=1 Tax=Accumulibacter sp. TaxID=2053492 RepID=UPI002B646F72|nr:phage minor head protein [Accumulibacter sp.]HMW55140.1 phage minor head protein [Accumulibacter sp.]HMX54674.1 phage minor head protein [Plasticicumulans sp.]